MYDGVSPWETFPDHRLLWIKTPLDAPGELYRASGRGLHSSPVGRQRAILGQQLRLGEDYFKSLRRVGAMAGFEGEKISIPLAVR